MLFWVLASIFCGIHAIFSYAAIWDYDDHKNDHQSDIVMIQSTLWWIAFFFCLGKIA